MVVEIDGDEVPNEEVYFWFDSPDMTSASLSTHIVAKRGGARAPRCREGVSDISIDLDGDRLTFAGFEDAHSNATASVPCDPALTDLHDRIARALGENETWERTSETLVMSGSSRVRLQSSGASD